MRSKNDTFKYQGGGDEPGPVVIKLLKELQGIQRGLIADPFGWVETVQPEQETDSGKSGASEVTPNQLP